MQIKYFILLLLIPTLLFSQKQNKLSDRPSVYIYAFFGNSIINGYKAKNGELTSDQNTKYIINCPKYQIKKFCDASGVYVASSLYAKYATNQWRFWTNSMSSYFDTTKLTEIHLGWESIFGIEMYNYKNTIKPIHVFQYTVNGTGTYDTIYSWNVNCVKSVNINTDCLESVRIMIADLKYNGYNPIFMGIIYAGLVVDSWYYYPTYRGGTQAQNRAEEKKQLNKCIDLWRKNYLCNKDTLPIYLLGPVNDDNNNDTVIRNAGIELASVRNRVYYIDIINSPWVTTNQPTWWSSSDHLHPRGVVQDSIIIKTASIINNLIEPNNWGTSTKVYKLY